MATASSLVAGRAYVLIEALDKTATVLSRTQLHIRQWANQMQSIGTIQLKVAIAGAIPLGYAIKQFAEYESRMSRISVLMDDAGRYMGTIRDELDRIAKTYGTPMEKLQTGITNMISGGMSPEESIKGMEVAAKAARGARIDVDALAEGIRRLVMGYRVTAEEATDLMFAMDRGGVNFEEMVLQLGEAVPVARAAGMSFEEFGASVAAISMVVPTPNVMTAMKNMASEFLKPSAEAKEMAAQYGLQMDVATMKTKGLAGVIKQIFYMPGKNLSQKMEDFGKIFPDVRGLLGITQIAQNLDQFDSMMEQVRRRTGMTQEAWDKVSGDTLIQLERATRAAEEAFRKLGEQLKDTTNSASVQILNLSQRVAEFISANQRMVVGVAAVVAALLFFGGTMVLLGLSFRFLSFSLWPLIAAFGMLAKPMALIYTLFASLNGVIITAPLAAVTLALFGVARAYYANKEAADAWIKTTSWYQNLTGAFSELGQHIDRVKQKYIAIGETAKITFMGLSSALMSGDLEAAWSITTDGLTLIWDEMINAMKTSWEEFQSFFKDAWTGYKNWATVKGEDVNKKGLLRSFVDQPNQLGGDEDTFMESGAKWVWRKLGNPFGLGGEEEQTFMSESEIQAARDRKGRLEGKRDYWENVLAGKLPNDGGWHPTRIQNTINSLQEEIDSITKQIMDDQAARTPPVDVPPFQEGSSVPADTQAQQERAVELENRKKALAARAAELEQKQAYLERERATGNNFTDSQRTRLNELLESIKASEESIKQMETSNFPEWKKQSVIDLNKAGIKEAQEEIENLFKVLKAGAVDGRTLWGEVSDPQTMLNQFFPGISQLGNFASGLMGMATQIINTPQEEKKWGALPQTQTIQKGSQEAAEAIKKAWQEANKPKDPEKQKDNQARDKILDFMSKINQNIQTIAGAEGV